MLELRVMTASGELPSRDFVYTSDRGLLAGPKQVTEAFDAGEIKLGDVGLGIGGRFLGAASRAELPAVSVAPRVASGAAGGGYRARLTRDGVTILEGIIPRADLELDRTTGAWTVPLVAGSADDLWTRLEKVRLGELREETVDQLLWHSIGSYRRDTAGGGVRYLQQGTHRWYDLRRLFRLVLEEAGIHGTGLGTVTVEGEVPVPRYSVRYLNASGDERVLTRPADTLICGTALFAEDVGYDARSLTLPDWSGAQLVETVLAMFGWRLAARYASYPSMDVLVEVLPDRWPEVEPAGLPALDERVARGGYTERLSRAGEARSFGVRYRGAARATSPQVEPPPTATAWPAPIGRVPAPPPPEALLAPDEWSFEPAARSAEPESSMEHLVDVPVLLADVVVTHAAQNAGGFGHPQYAEMTYSGLPAIDGVGPWVAHRIGTRLLHHHRVLAPAEGQRPLVHPIWASGLYDQRQLSRQPLEAIAGDFYTHGLASLRAGVPDEGATVEGRSYVVRERRWRLSDDRSAMELVRPAGTSPPAADRPRRTGPVQGLRARKYRVYQGTASGALLGGYVVVSWQPPIIERASVWRYEVQVRSIQTGQWFDAPEFVDPLATAHLHRRNGGAINDQVELRVRAVGEAGPGAWMRIVATFEGDEAPELEMGEGLEVEGRRVRVAIEPEGSLAIDQEGRVGVREEGIQGRHVSQKHPIPADRVRGEGNERLPVTLQRKATIEDLDQLDAEVSHLDQRVIDVENEVDTKYELPTGGVPKTDLEEPVRDVLDSAIVPADQDGRVFAGQTPVTTLNLNDSNNEGGVLLAATVYLTMLLSTGAPITIDGPAVLFQMGNITMANLPTSDPGVPGRLWNSSGTVMVSEDK